MARELGPTQPPMVILHFYSSLFNFFLDRAVILLALPAMVAAAVVLNGDFKIFFHRLLILNLDPPVKALEAPPIFKKSSAGKNV